MTDRAFETPDNDPFSQINPDRGGAILAPPKAAPAQPAPQKPVNPFDDLNPDRGGKIIGQQPETSATGALVRHAAESAVPALGSLPAAGAGAEIGGMVGGLPGAFIGGVAGFMGAGYALQKAQDYALSKLPDAWQDALGISEVQRGKEEAAHPVASFIGGLIPYALTLRPGFGAAAKLPENATSLQRLWANPVTQRLFPASIMGGMELGQEKVEGQPADWQKIGIATGFGLIFNKPTKFGERLTEIGAHPARRAFGLPEPTVAGAADAKVMGPGVNEQVFQGEHEMNPTAAMVAQYGRRMEMALSGEAPPAPDVNVMARASAPEAFALWDDLHIRESMLRAWIPEMEERGQEPVSARYHLADTERKIDELTPEIQAAYRRAGELAGVPSIVPEAGAGQFPTLAAMVAAQGRGGAPAAPAAPVEGAPVISRSIPEQAQFIADDVARRHRELGFTAEEATAAGEEIAARYIGRSAVLGGQAGSPQEMYQREGATYAYARGHGPPRGTQPPPVPPAAPPVAPAPRLGPVTAEEAAAAEGRAPGVAAPIAPRPRETVRAEGFAPLVREAEKSGMIENAEAYKAAAMRRRERNGGGGGKVYISAAAEAQAHGVSVQAANRARAEAETAKGGEFDKAIAEAKIPLENVGPEVRSTAIEAMINLGMEPIDALEYADAKIYRDATLHESEESRLAAEGIIETEEGYDLHGKIPFGAGAGVPHAGETAEAIGAAPEGIAGNGERAREISGVRAEEAEREYFQRRRDLVKEREAESLKPTVEQKPMDEGLFGEPGKQKELFQAPIYYSQVARTVEAAKQEKASAEQWLNYIKNQPGVKSEEMEWLGLPEWLKAHEGAVTKQEIADYVRANAIEVKEVEHGEAPELTLAQVRQRAAQRLPFHAVERSNPESVASVTNDKGELLPYAEKNADKFIFRAGTFEDAVSRKIGPKFPEYTLPGGENYRELLLTLPPKAVQRTPEAIEKLAATLYETYERRGGDPPWERLAPDVQQIYRERAQEKSFLAENPNLYRSSHWEEPNVLAHVRFDDRVTDGKKTLHVAEIQSDWHQAGRKRGYDSEAERARDLTELPQGWTVEKISHKTLTGFEDRRWIDRYVVKDPTGDIFNRDINRESAINGAINRINDAARQRRGIVGSPVPDAPFKTTWPELSLKRIIRYAAEHGYDRLSWDTGETNAERYSLAKRLDKLKVVEWPDGKYHIEGFKDNGKLIDHWANNKEELPGIIGKDRANAALEQIEQNKHPTDPNKAPKFAAEFVGDKIDIGGEGQKGFYDKILPAAANKLVKKFGAKVGESEVEDTEGFAPTRYEGPTRTLDEVVTAANDRRNSVTIGNQLGAVASSMRLGSSFAEAMEAQASKAAAEAIGGKMIELPKPGIGVHTLDITPELRTAATEQGFPLFQAAKASVHLAEGERPEIRYRRTRDISSFLHENSHVFFEEMTRDSQHPAAPQQLKDDLASALKWTGLDSIDQLHATTAAGKPTAEARAAHEKFAKGYERFRREGVAPSAALARIFAKFRDWLLAIYKAFPGERADRPIRYRFEDGTTYELPALTDEMRGVYGRLVAPLPERAVIAPELERRLTLPDIHESEARYTEPHEAEPVRERIAAERDRYAAETPPEIINEISQAEAKQAAKPGGEATAGPGGSAALEPGGGEPGLEPAGGAVRAEHGAIEPGHARAEPKGAELPGREPEKPAAGVGGEPGPRAADSPLAPGPSPLFGAAESPFLDRAGNIRLDTLTSAEDVRQAIRDAAHANRDFIGERRDIVTDGDVMNLAADIGKVGAEKLVRDWVVGRSFNAEEVMALRQLLRASATEVAQASWKVRAANSTDADVVAYAMAMERLTMVQKTVAGATAEAGRALRAFRNIREDAEIDQMLREATGKTLFQMRREAKMAAALDTAQKINKFGQDSQTNTFARMLLEYWINGLISGPATHTTYTIGNNILMLEKLGPETAVAAGVGAIRKALGRPGETVRMGEVAAGLAGMRRGLGPALQASIEALRTGVTTRLPGEEVQNILPFQYGSELATPGLTNEAAKVSDAMGSAFGMFRGIWDGFIGGGGLLTAGGVEGAPLIGARYSHLGTIPDIELRGVNVLPVGTVVRLPSRAIAAIHSYFRVMNYSIEKAQMAYRIAANEGLTGAAFDARVGDLRQNPTAAMMESAHYQANELTLMGQGGAFTQKLSELTNTPIFGVPVFKFIDPFVKISSNIIEQSLIERTPVGILSPEIRADLMGKNGTVAQDMATARMLVGTAYCLAVGGLAAEGYISGSGPSDPHQAAIWRLAGNQAHSVRIGEIWYDMHRLGPMGMLTGVAADLYEVAHKASEGDLLTAASTLQHAVTQNILDESFMRGPSDLIKAVEDPGRYGEAYIRNFASSFIPYSVGLAQIARATDPYSRQARSVMDAIKVKIPGLSESLLPRRDIWGEPMVSREALIAAGVTAIYEQRMSRDPVNLAMLELGVHPAAAERKIRNVPLTDDQYDDFQRIAGRMAKMRLDRIVNSPQWRTFPNHIKLDVIKHEIESDRNVAREMMLMKYPQIAKDAYDLRLKKLKD